MIFTLNDCLNQGIKQKAVGPLFYLKGFTLYENDFFRNELGTSMRYQVASGWGALAPQPMVVTQSSNVMYALGLSLLNLSNPFCILLYSCISSDCLTISYTIASSLVNISDCLEYGLVLLYILLFSICIPVM